MDKVTLNIDEKKKEITELLEKSKHIVLATCADSRVTVRSMCHVNIGLNIFFQTDSRFLKIDQIRKNPQVAFCLGSLQIEGTAELLGHPSEVTNAKFSEHFKHKHPRAYEMYAHTKNQIVVKVSPTLFTQWKYIDDKPCREFLDLYQNTAYREYYNVV
ncbi:MAG: pyridoxamine 5'-phosphate oxidase family protein [Pseudomonadota bacterium]